MFHILDSFMINRFYIDSAFSVELILFVSAVTRSEVGFASIYIMEERRKGIDLLYSATDLS